MSQFKIHTIESAPEAAQEALKAVKNANGFIPVSYTHLTLPTILLV